MTGRTTLTLIEQVRRKLPSKTDYAVAKALAMEQGQLTRILKGEFGLGTKAVMRVAEILERDVRDILVLAEEDKAKSETDKEFWGRRSPRISTSHALAILAFGFVVTGQDAQAATVYVDSLHSTAYTLCEVGGRLYT